MAVVFHHVGFEWPNGQIVFNDVSFSLDSKIQVLIGPNAAGKTTLIKLISGELEPTLGQIIRRREDLLYVFNQIETPPNVQVGDYIYASGSSSDSFVDEYLKGISFKSLCSELSGGQWTRVRLAKAILSKADFLIFDEPSNHLDHLGLKALHRFLDDFSGGVLIVPHDRRILSKAQSVLEITSQGLSQFTGSWQDYELWCEQERERLFRNLEKAKRKREFVSKVRHEKLVNQEKRQRRGRQQGVKSNLPKIIRGALKRSAQVTKGKIDLATQEDVANAVSEAWEAYQNLKVEPLMYARLPEVKSTQGKVIMEAHDFNFRHRNSEKYLWKTDLNFSFRGDARIVLHGANGSGKTTLLRLLQGENLEGESKGILKTSPLRAEFLNQDHSLLALDQSILQNLRDNVVMDESELRSLLAMFLFSGEKVHQKVLELSGGERLRVSLAKTLLAYPPPEALVLDEPTNNLDLVNIEFLENLLQQYRGALIVVSHDVEFLSRLQLTDEIDLEV